jgi:hypothetical protein
LTKIKRTAAAAVHARLRPGQRGTTARGFNMLDIIMLAIGFAFFGLSLAYTSACDRL